MALKSLGVIKIEISDTTILIIKISIILSVIASVFSVFLKYVNITKKDRYYYLQLLDFFLILNNALILIQLVFIFIIYPAEVNQTSMSPTLADKDNIIVFPMDKVDNGDIIILKIDFKYNNSYFGVEEGELLVKRVIASGGQSLYFDDNGQLFVDGKMINEDYLQTNLINNRFIGGSGCSESSPCVVPNDMYFVLGDNRSNSVDSPELGFFHKLQVYGVAKYKVKSIFDWETLK
jgi:signal peptidase I